MVMLDIDLTEQTFSTKYPGQVNAYIGQWYNFITKHYLLSQVVHQGLDITSDATYLIPRSSRPQNE